MATYNTAFGSLPGTNEMLGTTNTTGGGRQQVYNPQAQQRKQQQQQAQAQTAQTFAQLQQQGMARPAPQAPQARPIQQYGGSQQANEMRQRLQQQLQSFGAAPSRFDTQAFQQIRGAQAQNLQAEYQGQRKALDEDLARRGLFASSIGGGRMGDLAGQQSRALADLDARLLQQAAETQAADRGQLLSAGQGLAELAGSQDLQQFEANRVGQAAEFEQGLRAAEFGQQQYQQGSDIALRAGQAAQDYEKFSRDQELREAELLGNIGGQNTLAARQQGEQARQFDLEQQLRSQLGLGGLDIQRGQLGLDRERLTQQQADASAERALRQKLQTESLTAEERRQLADIDSRKALQAEELGLERDRFEADRDYRADQLGLNRDELTMRTNQIVEDQRLRGVEITNEDAYREAELEARTTQIANEFDISGRQITVDEARIKAQREIAEADNKAQLARLEAQQTFQGGEAGKERTFQQGETALDRQLRERLGLTEATGQVYNFNPATGRVEAIQGATGQTLEARRLGLTEAGLTGQFGGKLTQDALQNAYARAAQLSQTTGKQYTVNPETGAITQGTDSTLDAQLRQGQLTGQFGNKDTLEKLQQNLEQSRFMTQQTGNIYDAQGKLTGGTTIAGQEATFQRAQTMADSMSSQTGNQYKVVRDELTGMFSVVPVDGKQTQSAKLQDRQLAFQNAARLSEQSGFQYTVDATGNVVQERGADGRPLATNAASQANLDRQLRSSGQEFEQGLQRARQLSETTGFQYEPKLNTETQKYEAQAILDQNGRQRVATPVSQANLDRQLRQQLGMTEATGTVYDAAGAPTEKATLESRLREAGITGKFGEQTTLGASELSFNQAAEEARQLSQTTGFQYQTIFNPTTKRFDVQAIINYDGSQRLNTAASEALGLIGGQQTIAAQNASSQRRIAEDQSMASLLAALRAALGK